MRTAISLSLLAIMGTVAAFMGASIGYAIVGQFGALVHALTAALGQ